MSVEGLMAEIASYGTISVHHKNGEWAILYRDCTYYYGGSLRNVLERFLYNHPKLVRSGGTWA